MIRAFSAALEDNNLLVRRGALDLLVNCLRADGAAIKKASPEDRTILMNAAISVVLRRDLSLNRRLYTWLLGPHEQSDKQMAYLKEHSLDLLHSCLRVRVKSYLTEMKFLHTLRLKCTTPLLITLLLDHSRFLFHCWINGKLDHY